VHPIVIRFKPGCDDAAQECLDKLDRVEAQTKAKGKPGPCVLSTGIENGGRTIVVLFANALDQLAFMCAIGAATYEIKESDGA
jgi:hypothetical protein